MSYNTRFSIHDSDAAIRCFFDQGYAVIKNLYSAAEIAEAKAATDRLKQRAIGHGATYRQGNLVFWVNPDPNLGINVQGMQWPSLLEPALDAIRNDPRMLQILRPALGDNIRQIINQIHWKTPGSAFAVGFHRDRENRHPPEAFRFLERTYIQTGLSIDPMTPENGPLLVIPGSHRSSTPVKPQKTTNFSAGIARREIIEARGYSESDLVPVLTEPGDLVMWHIDAIHGSDANQSATLDRCLYINGYVDARHCMRGYWAFIKGQPIPIPPIDVPVLVQFEEIFDRLSPQLSDRPGKAYD